MTKAQGSRRTIRPRCTSDRPGARPSAADRRTAPERPTAIDHVARSPYRRLKLGSFAFQILPSGPRAVGESHVEYVMGGGLIEVERSASQSRNRTRTFSTSCDGGVNLTPWV
jgi:hypothetical protein